MSIRYADLDDIVFEDREKEYGSYEMRKRANQSLGNAALIAFLVFLLVVGSVFFPAHIFPPEPEPEPEINDMPVIVETVPVELEELPEELPEEIPEIPKIKAPQVSAVKFQIPDPKPDDEVLDTATIVEIEVFDTTNVGTEDQIGDGEGQQTYDFDEIADDGVDDILNSDAGKSDEPDPNAFIMAEEQPKPVNLDKIKELIGYPPMAKEAEIEGRVTVRILVDEKGKYRKHIVLKDPHPLLTKAVERQLPQLSFTPGIQGGKPIKLWVTIPFKFELNR